MKRLSIVLGFLMLAGCGKTYYENNRHETPEEACSSMCGVKVTYNCLNYPAFKGYQYMEGAGLCNCFEYKPDISLDKTTCLDTKAPVSNIVQNSTFTTTKDYQPMINFGGN